MDFHVRPLRRDEAALLDAVFAGLSAQSRYLRFHSPVRNLTAPMRQALLAVDERDHVALVAVTGQGTPLGVARLIRDPDRADEAEVAFEVVDAWHGRGVGRALLSALAERAADLGITRIHALVLAENTAARALLRSVFPVCLSRSAGATTELTCLPLGAAGWEITMDDILADLVG
ncbi:GNAT family N-acetyltransferase [Pseudonocardia pini]|uniref:GNAT family N-acetyltransferase n=1 Tax=Pseudonocardia pini TaxID=2758030 RepID=UPI0015F05923|nr:GNAT family N-acetyltransferase [Pseudonocardia pini]